jgi:hypothetical protein
MVWYKVKWYGIRDMVWYKVTWYWYDCGMVWVFHTMAPWYGMELHRKASCGQPHVSTREEMLMGVPQEMTKKWRADNQVLDSDGIQL